MTASAQEIAYTGHILAASTRVIHIAGITGTSWKRDVPPNDNRYGPWRSADYVILDPVAWKANSPVLYLVTGSDRALRYVGISRKSMSTRWRESPALCARTGMKLPRKQIFHSQCWRNIERESDARLSSSFDVYCITGGKLLDTVVSLGPPLSGLATLAGDDEGIAAAVERWICTRPGLVAWNIAMTGRAR